MASPRAVGILGSIVLGAVCGCRAAAMGTAERPAHGVPARGSIEWQTIIPETALFNLEATGYYGISSAGAGVALLGRRHACPPLQEPYASATPDKGLAIVRIGPGTPPPVTWLHGLIPREVKVCSLWIGSDDRLYLATFRENGHDCGDVVVVNLRNRSASTVPIPESEGTLDVTSHGLAFLTRKKRVKSIYFDLAGDYESAVVQIDGTSVREQFVLNPARREGFRLLDGVPRADGTIFVLIQRGLHPRYELERVAPDGRKLASHVFDCDGSNWLGVGRVTLIGGASGSIAVLWQYAEDRPYYTESITKEWTKSLMTLRPCGCGTDSGNGKWILSWFDPEGRLVAEQMVNDHANAKVVEAEVLRDGEVHIMWSERRPVDEAIPEGEELTVIKRRVWISHVKRYSKVRTVEVGEVEQWPGARLWGWMFPDARGVRVVFAIPRSPPEDLCTVPEGRWAGGGPDWPSMVDIRTARVPLEE